MKIVKQAFFIILLFFVCHLSYATQKNSFLTLTITNHSNEKLIFNGYSGYPDNEFTVIPKVILPGEQGIIMGSTTPNFDLEGEVKFKDSTNEDNLFTIIDRRQFHMGQPVFAMNNQKYATIEISRTINPEINPRAIMYVAAEVEIKNVV